jgi:hypothetical protein
MSSETDQVKSRYLRRQHLDKTDRYSMLNPSHCLMIQEKERELIG